MPYRWTFRTYLITRSRFVHQYDDEYESVKKTRRAGRPASAREDLLKMKVDALEKEYQNGFCLSHFAPIRLIPADFFPSCPGSP